MLPLVVLRKWLSSNFLVGWGGGWGVKAFRGSVSHDRPAAIVDYQTTGSIRGYAPLQSTILPRYWPTGLGEQPDFHITPYMWKR